MSAQATKSLSRRAAFYVAIMCIAILGLEGWREWTSYQSEIQRVVGAELNLAHSLRQHADDTIELIEYIVNDIAADAGRGGIDQPTLIEQRMRRGVDDSSRPLRLDIYDANGKSLATTSRGEPSWSHPTLNRYFENHKASASLSAFLGPPIRLPNGDSMLTVSQRFNRPDGSFGGVVVATLDSQYFSIFYTGFDVGRLGSVSLLTEAGVLLARWPYKPQDIGRNLNGTELFAAGLSVKRTGSSEVRSPFDGVRRITTFDSGRRYPIVMVVAVARDEALAPWFAGAVQRGILTVLLTLGTALLGLRFADQISRRQRSEAALARQEAEFRLLAESASDLVEHFAPDGSRLYVSPAMERLTGHRAEDRLGHNAFDSIHADDRPAAQAAAQRLRSGESYEETVVFRAHHADGHEMWLETALRVADETGVHAAGIVGVTRDVTERKQLEMTLANLANIDGLTGLANRRAFDEALAREVARCRRSQMPLSLLMIDCDHFKRFNDDYGHLAGDGCLKAVAAVLKSRARRPGDLAARYGGEEMALLLPETELDGARTIGDAICSEVRELGIRHERNLPWQVSTISVGVATLRPGDDHEGQGGAWLLNSADLALYDAKAQGRNQCVAPPLADTARLVG